MILTLLACVSPTPVDSTVVEPRDCDLQLTVTENPISPLNPIASIEGEDAFSIRFWSDEVTPRRTRERAGPQPVIGLRADTEYALQALSGDRCSDPTPWVTGALPDDLASFEVETPWNHDDDGLIVQLGPARPMSQDTGPWVFGVDRQGHVVWLLELGLTGLGRDVREAADGSLWVASKRDIRRLSAWGEDLDTIEPEREVHHDFLPTDEGVLVMFEVEETHDVHDYGEVPVRGDLLVELDTQGNELWSWSAFDHLDVQTFDAELAEPRWENEGYIEWTHGNGMSWGDDGTLVVSLRNTGQVLGIDRDSGDIAWSLDRDDLDDGFRGQHAPLLEDGLVTVFDNLSGETSRVGTWDRHTGELVWSHPLDAVTATFGSAERLGSGDLVVTAIGQRDEDVPGQILQVTSDGEVVWSLTGFQGHWAYRGRPLEGHVTVE